MQNSKFSHNPVEAADAGFCCAGLARYVLQRLLRRADGSGVQRLPATCTIPPFVEGSRTYRSPSRTGMMVSRFSPLDLTVSDMSLSLPPSRRLPRNRHHFSPTGLLGVGLGGDSSPRMIAFQARLEF